MTRNTTDTVLRALRKKEAALESVNTALLRAVDPDEMIVDIQQAGEAEMDEMKCGVLSARKATHDGCGMLLIITRERSWRMSLVAGKTRSFCS